MGDVPVISVVIPLPDDRGYADECLSGFTQQTLNVPHEIIVAADAKSPDEISSLIEQFPQVHWIYRPGLRMNAHYNEGAAEARGKYLYITESHCVPRRDCLQQIYDFVQQSELQVACSASDGNNGNYLAECEQLLFEEDFQKWIDSKKGKFAIRGTLIERVVWQQVGGFQAGFGHYSELLIGRTLEAAGIPIGYAEKSWVAHGNQVDLMPLVKELLEYGEDECRACHRLPADMQVGTSREWAQREQLQKNLAVLRFRQRKEVIRQRIREYALCYLPLPAKLRLKVFRRLWQGVIRQGRLQYIASMRHQNAGRHEVIKTSESYRKAA